MIRKPLYKQIQKSHFFIFVLVEVEEHTSIRSVDEDHAFQEFTNADPDIALLFYI